MKKLNMKHLIQTLLISCLLLPLAAQKAKATNQSDVQMALQNAIPMSAIVYATVTTTPGSYGQDIAAVFSYTGASTESFMFINTSNIQFAAPYGSTDTVNVAASVGSGGIIILTSTVTIGTVCDIINQSVGGVYGCKLVGAVRSDIASTILLSTFPASGGSNNATLNLKQVGGFAVPIGTSSIVSLGIIPAAYHGVVLQRCYTSAAANASTPLAPNLTVYGVPRKWAASGNVANQAVGGKDIFGNLLNDSTIAYQIAASTSAIQYYPVNAAVYDTQNWIRFGPDQHVVVRLGSSGDGTQQAITNYVGCDWIEQ